MSWLFESTEKYIARKCAAKETFFREQAARERLQHIANRLKLISK